MNTQDNILNLYYNQHLKQKDIAIMLGISKQYVSKIIKADSRYKLEKETRKNSNVKKRKIYMQDYFKNYARPKKDDNSYQQLKAQLDKDTQELSYSNSVYMSDYTYAKWNHNAYHRNKKGNLVIDKKLNFGYNTPKTIDMNVKVPTQKYKHRCYSM